MSGEIARGWPVLAGATIGISLSVATYAIPALAILMPQLQATFGWQRASIALGPMIINVVLLILSPAVGWAADRVGSAWTCGSGMIGLSVSLFAMGRLGSDIHLFWMACAAMASVSASAGTVVYARAISMNFERQRGLALGLAMVGSGMTGILLPALLTPFAAYIGWRAALSTLGLIVAASAPVVVLSMTRAPSRRERADVSTSAAGLTFRAIVRDRLFWTLAIAFMLIPLGVGGAQFHLIARLADAGVAPARAGAIASISGAVLIGSRVGTGWLLDRISAAAVAATASLTSAALIAALAVLGAKAAVLAPMAFGLCMGAEVDLVGYMTASCFRLKNYGRVYGLLYAAILLGSSISVLLYGAVFDAAGSYGPALAASAAALFAAGLLFLLLYHRNGRPHAEDDLRLH